jgi:hypothetical protein
MMLQQQQQQANTHARTGFHAVQQGRTSSAAAVPV